MWGCLALFDTQSVEDAVSYFAGPRETQRSYWRRLFIRTTVGASMGWPPRAAWRTFRPRSCAGAQGDDGMRPMDGRRESLDTQPDEPGWWLASDGRWYPPELSPGSAQPPADAGTRFCPHCGAQTAMTDTFCARCGSG